MKRRYYIAYGSNLNMKQMRFRCPQAEIIGTSEIKDYELLFKGSQTGSYLTVEKKKGGSVPVAVWATTAADEAALDRYEGFPNYYVKLRRRVVLSDGSEIEGMVYVMILIRRQPPTAEYYRAIRDAYRQLGFRDEIARVLEPALCRSRARNSF